MSEEEKEQASEPEVKKVEEVAKKEKTFTQADIDKLIAKEVAKFKDYDDLKKEYDSLKKEKLSEQEKALEDIKEAKEKEFEPVKNRVSKLEAAMLELLDLEMSDIPEDKLHLVTELMPDSLSPEDKVAWLKKAKAGGIFVSGKKDSSTSTKPGETAKATTEKVDILKLAKENPQEYSRYFKEKYGISVRLSTKNKKKNK